MRFLEIKGKEIKDPEKVMGNLYQGKKNLFSNNVPVSNRSISNYLNYISLKNLSMEQRKLCKGKLTKNKVKDALNNKAPGNNVLTKAFCEIEKVFGLVNHLFIFHMLEKFGFGKNFVKWIALLLTNQESCIINGRKTSTLN